MFREVPGDTAVLLANEDLTVNAHFFCVFDKVGLINYYFILKLELKPKIRTRTY